MLGSLMDFALSRCASCRLLLPLEPQLQPLAERLRCMALAAYRSKKSQSSVQKKSKERRRERARYIMIIII